jgi:hypothetical protein
MLAAALPSLAGDELVAAAKLDFVRFVALASGFAPAVLSTFAAPRGVSSESVPESVVFKTAFNPPAPALALLTGLL